MAGLVELKSARRWKGELISLHTGEEKKTKQPQTTHTERSPSGYSRSSLGALQQAAPWNKSLLSALSPPGDRAELPSSKGCHLPNWTPMSLTGLAVTAPNLSLTSPWGKGIQLEAHLPHTHGARGRCQETLLFESPMIRILLFQPLLQRLGPLGSWWQLIAFEGY